MVIYTDAGLSNRFKYFIFTNMYGRILGYHLGVAKETDNPPLVEMSAVVAAIYWTKLKRGRNHTIVTDCKTITDLLATSKRPGPPDWRTFQKLIKQLVLESKVNLIWVPRDMNIAGKVLEQMPSPSGEAQQILNYFKEKH